VNLWVLYLLLLKATLTSFSGLASLPIVRQDLVVTRGVLTDRDLNTAVVLGRTTPGPKGLYLVCVGYQVAGVPGAVAGSIALMTPAVLVVPLIVFAGRRAQHPRVRAMLNTVVLASAGISLSATLPMAVDALTSWLMYGLAIVSAAVLLRTQVDTVWVIAAAALVSLFMA
jgi:chromate transporter